MRIFKICSFGILAAIVGSPFIFFKTYATDVSPEQEKEIQKPVFKPGKDYAKDFPDVEKILEEEQKIFKKEEKENLLKGYIKKESTSILSGGGYGPAPSLKPEDLSPPCIKTPVEVKDYEKKSRRFSVVATNKQIGMVVKEYGAGFPKAKELIEEQKNRLDKTLAFDEGIAPTAAGDKYLSVLSIDGGGVRGFMPAIWLERIEAKANMPIHKLFDYVGGTSIGGILALGVTASVDKQTPLLKTTELKDLFLKHGRTIFPSDTFLERTVSYFNIAFRQYLYDPKPFDGLLRSYFKQATLDTTLTNVFITSQRADVWEMYSFDSYLDKHKTHKLFDVARATSAAPFFFPGYNMPKVGYLLDGGIVANNPIIDVYNAGLKLKLKQNMAPDPSNQFIVSLGTGITTPQIEPDDPWLLTAWNLAVGVVMNYMSESAEQNIKRVFSSYPNNYLRVNAEVPLHKFINIGDASSENLGYLKDKAEELDFKIDEFFSGDHDGIQRLLDVRASAHS